MMNTDTRKSEEVYAAVFRTPNRLSALSLTEKQFKEAVKLFESMNYHYQISEIPLTQEQEERLREIAQRRIIIIGGLEDALKYIKGNFPGAH